MNTSNSTHMRIQVIDNDAVEMESGSTAADLAKQLKLNDPGAALAVHINGVTRDLSTPLNDGDTVHFLDFESPEGKEVYWHTTAHILAQAVLRLWPDAKPTIGPPIENGLYYDFADLVISDADFPKIEKEMKKIISENHQTERKLISDKAEALRQFADNPYKCELIEGLPEGEAITAYQQGEFYDLCRGPHLANLGKVKAVKVLKTSGAYWRGDSDKEMLTRIYAISFPDRNLLKEYLHRLEEARKRDHKVLGPKLGLFTLKEEAAGMPFILPHGMIIWQALLDYWREEHQAAGYQEIKTPVMMSRSLWELSGHWENYRENMFTSDIDERQYAIKPMNCPGACLVYNHRVHSYREFPLRVGEIGLVHRYEASGALSGLMRVRCFHQDDAHIFLLPAQIEAEILHIFGLMDRIFTSFGLNYHLELSTRPEKSIGSDEIWETSTNALRRALEQSGRDYVVNEGDGAFYGPKIDVHIKDALGRTWQCSTIQLDMSLPERFDLEYTSEEGTRERPVMLHRVIYGSIERFFGILIEHFAGKFPFWISPRQIRILPVADRHLAFAENIADKCRARGLHVSIDSSHESVGKKVRNAQLDQVNYMLTVGDQELDNGTISVRTRDNVVHGEVDIDLFIQKVCEERDQRALTSPFCAK